MLLFALTCFLCTVVGRCPPTEPSHNATEESHLHLHSSNPITLETTSTLPIVGRQSPPNPVSLDTLVNVVVPQLISQLRTSLDTRDTGRSHLDDEFTQAAANLITVVRGTLKMRVGDRSQELFRVSTTAINNNYDRFAIGFLCKDQLNLTPLVYSRREGNPADYGVFFTRAASYLHDSQPAQDGALANLRLSRRPFEDVTDQLGPAALTTTLSTQMDTLLDGWVAAELMIEVETLVSILERTSREIEYPGMPMTLLGARQVESLLDSMRRLYHRVDQTMQQIPTFHTCTQLIVLLSARKWIREKYLVNDITNLGERPEEELISYVGGLGIRVGHSVGVVWNDPRGSSPYIMIIRDAQLIVRMVLRGRGSGYPRILGVQYEKQRRALSNERDWSFMVIGVAWKTSLLKDVRKSEDFRQSGWRDPYAWFKEQAFPQWGHVELTSDGRGRRRSYIISFIF